MKLGILSGAGAFSGLFIHKKILEFWVCKYNPLHDNDFPYIFHYNHPFSGTSNIGVSDHKKIKKELKSSLITLANCDKIIIGCNSMHMYIPLKYNKKIISLVEFGKKQINKKTLILCSESSSINFLFGNTDFHFYLPNNLQKITNSIIQNIIVNEQFNTDYYFSLIENYLKTNNLNQLLIGCTEISMLDWNKFKKQNPQITVIDTIDLAIQTL